MEGNVVCAIYASGCGPAQALYACLGAFSHLVYDDTTPAKPTGASAPRSQRAFESSYCTDFVGWSYRREGGFCFVGWWLLMGVIESAFKG